MNVEIPSFGEVFVANVTLEIFDISMCGDDMLPDIFFAS